MADNKKKSPFPRFNIYWMYMLVFAGLMAAYWMNDNTMTKEVPQDQFAACENAGLADFVPGGRESSSGQFGKNRGETARVKVGSHKETQSQFVKTGQEWVSTGRQWNWDKWAWEDTGYWKDVGTYQNVEVDVDDYEVRPKTSYDRRYYESVCKDSVISQNSSAINQIDAVLYNNHTICGHVGTNSKGTSFNGALVCRNEAIMYTTPGLFMNWDIRLYSGSSETVDNDKVGLAKSSDNPPEVIDWREIPDGVVAID